MMIFLAITSVLNLALGYLLATYVITGSFVPTLGSGAVDLPVGSGGERAGPEARVSYRIPQPQPSEPLTPPTRLANSAGAVAEQSPVATPSMAKEPAVSSTPAPGTDGSPGSASPAATRPEANVPKADDAPSSTTAAEQVDGQVEEKVLAGIEAFRAQLAEMKEQAALGSLADG